MDNFLSDCATTLWYGVLVVMQGLVQMQLQAIVSRGCVGANVNPRYLSTLAGLYLRVAAVAAASVGRRHRKDQLPSSNCVAVKELTLSYYFWGNLIIYYIYPLWYFSSSFLIATQ